MSNIYRLHRFRSINEFLYQELELSELFAADPNHLNDPFDCQIDAIAAIDRISARLKDPARLKVLKNMRANFEGTPPALLRKGICCFSKRCDSLTMWSHYARAHSGVCLTYEFDADELAQKYASERSDRYVVAIADVEYGRSHFSDWLSSGNFDDPIYNEPVASAAAKTLVVKSDDWEYEDEVRLIMSEPGPVELPSNSITQILFGVRTSDSAKRAIKSIATRKNPDIIFGQSHFTGEADFGLEFEDL